MKQIKIRIFHMGWVCVSPYLPFGGDKCNIIKASGMTTKKEDRLWLPVSSYMIEHPKGKILVDCGWHRDMSPKGEYDIKVNGGKIAIWKALLGMTQKALLGKPLIYLAMVA